jgi:hypothetical protein
VFSIIEVKRRFKQIENNGRDLELGSVNKNRDAL